MFPASSGVLFFGAEGEKPVSWNSIPEFEDVTDIAEEQSKVFATMRNSATLTFNVKVTKKDIEALRDIISPFKIVRGKGPVRKRMMRRAKKLRTNAIFSNTFTLRKEGDHYVDERGAFRFILQ